MLENRMEELDEGARLEDLCFDAARARIQQLNEEDMLGLYVKHLPQDVDAETLIGRVPDRVWSFSIHCRPRRMVEERRVQEEAEAEHRVAFDALREEDLFHDEERERHVAVWRAFNARSRRWEEEEERAEEEERWAHAAFNSLQQVKLSLS